MSRGIFLGVVSDTHGRERFAVRAVRVLEPFAPLAVLHCGDVGSGISQIFAQFPMHYVRGNTDDAATAELEAEIRESGGRYHGEFGELDFAGRTIAFLHGDRERRLDEAIRSGRYDLVCSGHTHKVSIHREGRTLALNPGALHRAAKHTCAIVELETLDVTILTCDESE